MAEELGFRTPARELEELREADLIIDSLEEITIDDLERLLHQPK